MDELAFAIPNELGLTNADDPERAIANTVADNWNFILDNILHFCCKRYSFRIMIFEEMSEEGFSIYRPEYKFTVERCFCDGWKKQVTNSSGKRAR